MVESRRPQQCTHPKIGGELACDSHAAALNIVEHYEGKTIARLTCVRSTSRWDMSDGAYGAQN